MIFDLHPKAISRILATEDQQSCQFSAGRRDQMIGGRRWELMQIEVNSRWCEDGVESLTGKLSYHGQSYPAIIRIHHGEGVMETTDRPSSRDSNL